MAKTKETKSSYEQKTSARKKRDLQTEAVKVPPHSDDCRTVNFRQTNAG